VPCQAGQEWFTDVPATSPFCRWIEQLARDGLSAGCGGAKFCPQSPVTREQIAMLLERAFQALAPRRQLDVSPRHSCALLPSGRAECWGSGLYDASPPASEMFSSISAGLEHTCGVTRDGPVSCWPVGWPVPPARSFVAVSAGYTHDCGILADHTVICWGTNDSNEASPTPTGAFMSVAAGGAPPFSHSCGVRTDGTLECWGYWKWKEPLPAGKFLSVSAGSTNTCGVRQDRTVVCWGGDNLYGESTAPPGLFLSVSAGTSHTCGVKEDGTVACWGSNTFAPAGTFSAVSAGQSHTCGLKDDGSVVCWGATGWGAETPPAWLQ
jgi:alpha-tubulin suppressor-like RCC1 family protein